MKAWEKELRPYAKKLDALDRDISRAVKKMSAAKLHRMVAACRKASDSNCWWATYQVRNMVYHEVVRQIHARGLTLEKEKT